MSLSARVLVLGHAHDRAARTASPQMFSDFL